MTKTANFDVDLVVLWVDGSDPAWRKERSECLAKEKGVPASSIGENRVRDWGLMKYWFRAVEKYVPWVRKVFFVTWGHLPEFLNTTNPKLQIVKHEEFMPEGTLPTFSSKALELNLWRIPGLSEHFLYLNDDMFFTKPCEKTDFFDAATGLPKLSYQEMPLRFKCPGSPWEDTVMQSLAVVNNLFPKKGISMRQFLKRGISREYSLGQNMRNFAAKVLYPEYYAGFKAAHGLAPLTRTFCQLVWEKAPDIMEATSHEAFRKPGLVNQWVFAWAALASGKFIPGAESHMLFNVDESNVDIAVKAVQAQFYRSVCINDPDYNIDFEACRERIDQAFQSILPEPCSFEKEAN